ncbi:MAG: FprA family A-type flavoprotein [Actinobacteria bacterium]|nr:FprA family A-type flavoprotein [Actinomycetota bacterium]
MEKTIKIKENVFYVGVNDPQRRLFDELIPLPDGTTYNAYIVKGSKKTALIDTADPPKSDVLLSNLKNAGVAKIDYIISHHGEQDHSGSIPVLLSLYPDSRVLTNDKCKAELIDMLCIDEDRVTVIKDGEEVSLGDKTLRFIFTPWVHWPETFITYLPEDKILFTCDFLGSHFAFDAGKGLFVENNEDIYLPAKRYYAEIMSPFRTVIRKNLGKIKDIEVDILAPSHGPLYRGKDFIESCYNDWSSDAVKNKLLLAYVSMHGSTGAIARYFIEALKKRGIEVAAFDLADADVGELAMELIESATAVIGSPTVLAGPHPKAVYAAYLVKALRPKTRYLSVIGSYSWGGKMVEQLVEMLGTVGAEIIEPVMVKGYPVQEDFSALDDLAEKIKLKHQNLGLL